MLYFVVSAALFCRWQEEKPLLGMVTRGNAWKRPSFFPPNTLSYTTSTLRRLQYNVDLVDLMGYFILSCFEERGWEKLLGDLPRVCEPLIRKFYANAILINDYINCWVRGNEFTLEVGDIDGVLGHGDLDHEGFTSFKGRMLSIETVQSRIGGAREGKCLNTTTFPTDLRCLTYIMLFNLYLVGKMTTITMLEPYSSWSS